MVIAEQKQELLYATAYALYETGDYAGATDVFTTLCLKSPFSEVYWRGLASSRQMQKEYEAALPAWALVALLCEKDPLPHFHAAECYLSLQNREEALKALKAAEGLLTTSQEHARLKEKIQILG